MSLPSNGIVPACMRPLWSAWLAAGFALLCSCGPDRLGEPGGGVSLRVRQTLEPLVSTGDTRAAEGINDTYLAAGETLTVTVESEAYSFRTTDASGGMASADPEGGPFFPAGGGSIMVGAWYPPVMAYAPSPQPFIVAADQSAPAGYKASDLMYGQPLGGNPVSPTASAVPIRFTHRMAKVRVRVITGGVPVTGVSLTGIRRRVVFTPSSGLLGEAEEVAGETTVIMYSNPSGIATEFTCAALVPPQVLAERWPLVVVMTDSGRRTYRLPAAVALKSGREYTYTVRLTDRPMLPVDYVAPFNMMTPTQMAKDHQANHSMYFHWGAGTTAMSPVMQSFKNGTALRGYHLPSVEEWMAILPPHYTGEIGNAIDVEGEEGTRINYRNGLHLDRKETVAWGVVNDNGIYTYDVRQKFSNDYNCPDDAAHQYIGYALRFKELGGQNGKYTCAFRFQYIQELGDIGCKSLKVQVRYVGANPAVSISTISDESWWTSPQFTLLFPSLGHLGDYQHVDDYAAGSYSIAQDTDYSYYWTGTGKDDNFCFGAHFSSRNINGNFWFHPGYAFPIRLFADK